MEMTIPITDSYHSHVIRWIVHWRQLGTKWVNLLYCWQIQERSRESRVFSCHTLIMLIIMLAFPSNMAALNCFKSISLSQFVHPVALTGGFTTEKEAMVVQVLSFLYPNCSLLWKNHVFLDFYFPGWLFSLSSCWLLKIFGRSLRPLLKSTILQV